MSGNTYAARTHMVCDDRSRYTLVRAALDFMAPSIVRMSFTDAGT